MVNTLVMSAENDDVLLQRQVVGNMLVELFAVGRREYHLVVVALRFQCRDAAVDRLYLHHHSREAPVRVVIHASPFVKCIVSEVVQMNLCQPLLLSPGKNRLVNESLYHLGQYGNNVYSH